MDDFSTRDGVQRIIDRTPMHRLLGFTVDALDSRSGTLTISAATTGNAERSDGSGQAHGGAIATLIDSTATFACCISLNRPVPTINLRVDYLRPATGETMIATSKVQRIGRSIGVVDVEVISGGKCVAIGRADLSTAAP
jgi:uncharacterized protein (TIGR00369 family)